MTPGTRGTRTSDAHARQETASQRGKANTAKGKRTERDLVTWLRAHGWPGAERTIRTGHRVPGRVSADRGDVDGTPLLAWQVKDVAEREIWQIPNWLAATGCQRAAAGADLGILVVKRRGHADPGRWWAWLTLDEVIHEALTNRVNGLPYPLGLFTVPVRLALADLAPILHFWGYGTCTDETCVCGGLRHA